MPANALALDTDNELARKVTANELGFGGMKLWKTNCVHKAAALDRVVNRVHRHISQKALRT